VNGAVEVVEFLGIEFSESSCEIVSDDVFDDVVFDFGGFFDFVVGDLEYF
jgi:hypothetical protein